MSALVGRMQRFRSTIFTEISQLANDTGALNLGQGFPDTDGPPSLLADAATNMTEHGINQYPPGPGMPVLREAVAEHQRRFYGLEVDPGAIVITTGATEAIAAALLALCEPGDEVVVFEPAYDSYAACAALARARLRPVALRPPAFDFDEEALMAAFSPATRVVLLNTPHNPTGVVFSRRQLELICELAAQTDAVIVSDEVYEHMTFDGAAHIPPATIYDNTLTVSSAGKTFSVTGWKVGWAHGPAPLAEAVAAVKQYLTFHGGAPFQPAVANALALPDDFYSSIGSALQTKRDLLAEGCRAAGFEVSVPSSTYFMLADATSLGVQDGVTFAYDLPRLCGVAAVPVSVFALTDEYRELCSPLIRFAFCKRDEALAEACQRLAELAPARSGV